jgi:glutathione S-transferase
MSRHFALLNAVATSTPALFAPPSVLTHYCAALIRWAALYPSNGPRWFRTAEFPALLTAIKALEARPATLAAIKAEGLGPTPFSAPSYPQPPEGVAL